MVNPLVNKVTDLEAGNQALLLLFRLAGVLLPRAVETPWAGLYHKAALDLRRVHRITAALLLLLLESQVLDLLKVYHKTLHHLRAVLGLDPLREVITLRV